MAYANVYRPDRLFLPQQKLSEFAGTVPTPFYLYHEDGIRKAAQLIRGSFCWAPTHLAWFPISVNNCPAILKLFREAGFGALARSIPELALAQGLGFSEIAFHTAAMTPAAAQAASVATTVIFDAPGQIEALGGRLPERCLVRCCPESVLTGDRRHGRRKQKAGMDRAQILQAVLRLKELGAAQIGLHCHIASAAADERFYPSVASGLFALARDIAVQTGVQMDVIDSGGGVSARSATPGAMLQLSRVGTLVRDAYRSVLPPELTPALHTEFGRYAVSRHGLLICRVIELREQARSYAILDAGTAQLPDLLFGGQRHPISVVGNCGREGRRVYSVHGCTPDTRELICDRAILPELKPGSLIAIHFAGGCCESMQLPRAMLPGAGSYLYTRDGRFVPTA